MQYYYEHLYVYYFYMFLFLFLDLLLPSLSITKNVKEKTINEIELNYSSTIAR